MLDGDSPGSAYAIPRASFTSSTGATTTIPSAQDEVTLVYVGYTSCPDVCPLIMADTATALRKVKRSLSSRVRVVMITSDPVRDTPTVMREWIDGFAFPSATKAQGLTGDWSTILAAASGIGVPLPKTEPVNVADVEHGSQLQAFIGGRAIDIWLPSDPDHLAKDIEHDLPLLLTSST